ncbi:MAG TPA: NAD(P)-dependent oxidoreductase, partial [Euzebyales bacterium]|nr:NAD(P)-dependent oxidoreductase [Euzebyales bacterium]
MDVGFVGLGAMGRPMAANIAAAGHRVRAWNRSPVDAPDGVELVASPAEVARASAVTVVMVADAEAVRAVLSGDDGWLAGAGDGALLVQSSTIGPAATRDLAATCAEHGVRFVDAPVSGSVAPAREAALVVLAGGGDADLADAAPVFDAIGRAVVRCGGVGSGSAVKLAVNATLITAMAGAAEALTWLAAAEPGLALDAVAPVFERISPLVARRAGALVGDAPEGGFSLAPVAKDMDLVAEAMAPADVLEAVRARRTIATYRFEATAVECEGLGETHVTGDVALKLRLPRP